MRCNDSIDKINVPPEVMMNIKNKTEYVNLINKAKSKEYKDIYDIEIISQTVDKNTKHYYFVLVEKTGSATWKINKFIKLN